MQNQIPTIEYAIKIVEQFSNSKVESIKRFTTGNCHFVYDVLTKDGRKFVPRIAFPQNKLLIEGALFWNKLLKPKGVPLPKIYHFDFEARFPYLILERFKGVDLWQVYAELSTIEKRDLAREMAKLQSLATTLPKAKCFGYLETYKSNAGSGSWLDLTLKMTNRSRSRLEGIGVFDVKIVDELESKLSEYSDYFLEIEPSAYFHDITTKNVLIDKGKLSGIVDVDSMCFGDSIQTMGLTKMALLQDNHKTDYVDFWAEEMKLNKTQKRMINLYATMACVDFISELGQQFNSETKVEVNLERTEKLHLILKDLMQTI